MRKTYEKIKKAMTAFLLCGVLIGTQWMNVNAAEPEENESEGTGIGEINYDMEQGGSQIFIIKDEDGEKSELVIEEMPRRARVANGTYKITWTKPKAWLNKFCSINSFDTPIGIGNIKRYNK